MQNLRVSTKNMLENNIFMKKKFFLYFDPSLDPAFNLALEELLTLNSTGSCFMLWRNGPSVIIGRNQNTSAEINAEAVREKKIQIVRRITGGGAVYHDEGNINFSYISPSAEWTADSPAEFTRPVITMLRGLGIHAEFSGRNDILADGLKISGCARSVLGKRTLFHGTLLFDADLSVLAEVLNPDPLKISSKGIKSVRARVGNIRSMLSSPMTADEFLETLRRGAESYFGVKESEFPAGLTEEAGKLAASRYRSWNWNYGTNLSYSFSKAVRFSGGTLRAGMNIRENRIADLRFTGDFFGSHPVDALESHLNGLPPRAEEICRALSGFPLDDFIAGASPELIAALLSLE